MEFSHRDRRAQRAVGRAFFGMVAVTLALIGVSLVVPLWFAGLVGVVALGILGIGYLGWSDALLESYSNDLRDELAGGRAGGFLRAEIGSPAGLDRDVGRPTARSPHARRRTPERLAAHDDAPVSVGAGSDQP